MIWTSKPRIKKPRLQTRAPIRHKSMPIQIIIPIIIPSFLVLPLSIFFFCLAHFCEVTYMDPIIISYYSTIQKKITKTWILVSPADSKETRKSIASTYGKYVNADPDEILAMFSAGQKKIGSNEDLFANVDLTDLSTFGETHEENVPDSLSPGEMVSIKQPFKSTGSETEIISSISIFPYDRINDVALKICTLINVPYYRLHLDYIDPSGHVKGLYRLNANGPMDTRISGYPVDMINIGPDLFVDKYLYDIRKDVEVYVEDIFNVAANVKFYMISDLNELLVRANFSDQFTNDMIYYGLVVKYWPQNTLLSFRDYIVNENSLSLKFPELARNLDLVKNQYKTEKTLLNNIKKTSKPKDIITAINRCTISGVGPGPVNLRNVFDALETNDPGSRIFIPEIHYFLKSGTETAQFSKVHYGTKMRNVPNQQILRAGLTVVLVRNSDIMYFSLHPNGRWFFKTIFAEEDFMTFEKMTDYVQKFVGPVLTKINKIGPKGSPAGPLIIDDMSFDHISASLFWKKILTENQFKELIKSLDTYVSAGLLGSHDVLNTVKDSQMYVFRKGTFEFDGSLINRVLMKAGKPELRNQFEYLVNPVVKAKWNELYQGRIIRILHRASDISIEIQDAQRNEFELFVEIMSYILKESGIHESNPSYVKNNLSKSKEQDPVLFNLKKAGYPVVYARICQKKMQPVSYQENELGSLPDNIRKKLVKYKNFTYNRPAYYMCPGSTYKYLNFIAGVHPAGYCLPCCFKTPISDRERKAKQIFESCTQRFKGPDELLSESKHILATNKVLDPGRIGHIPSVFMKILPRDTYMYGTIQWSRSIFCPMLSIGSLLLQELKGRFMSRNDPVDYFINELYDRLRTKGKTFIPDLDPNELISTFARSDSLQNDSIDWNSIITRALSVFWGITIVFCTNDDIDLPMPGSMTDKIVFVIKRNYTKESSVNHAGPAWYPVCRITQDYFKESKIGSCIFSLEEDLDILRDSLEEYQNIQESNVNKRPGADTIIKFLGLTTKDYLKYVGRNNKVYGISFRGLNIPVDYSDYASGKERISFDPMIQDNDPKALKEFLESFEVPGYIGFNVTQVLKSGNNFVGIIVNGLQCKHRPVPVSPFMRPEWTEENRTVTISYDVDNLNKSLLDGPQKMSGPKESRASYKYYLYDLVLMQVINYMNTLRDPEITARIRETFSSSTNTSTALKSIADIMPRNSEDFSKMVDLIQKKKDILSARYSWDETWAMKNVTKEGIRDIIDKTCTRVSSISVSNFPNVFEPCPGRSEYCSGDKLLVYCDDSFWENLPDMIIDDLTDEIKQVYLKDRIYYDNIIDEFAYSVGPNETLFIRKK